MLTLLEVIQRTTEYFKKAGLDTPRLDAELILAEILGFSRMQLYQEFERPMTESELERLRPLVKRRARREPLQHILGQVEFFGVQIRVDGRALVPRPETEELADLLSRQDLVPRSILDLGTGTGALALAMAKHYADAKVVAVDRSAEALTLARENAELNGLVDRVSFLQGDWFEPLEKGMRFDLILSNPPYLTDEEWKTAAPEVREFEPREALVSEDAGCSDLERILSEAPRYLSAGGLLALETGIEQHARLEKVAREMGWGRVESLRDMSGRDRFLLARLAEVAEGAREPQP